MQLWRPLTASAITICCGGKTFCQWCSTLAQLVLALQCVPSGGMSSRFRATVPLAGLLLVSISCTGCVSWQSREGTRHTLILGFGIVSAKSSPGHTATAVRSHTLGVSVHTGSPYTGVVVGYQSLQQTVLVPEWQGIIEVSATPGQPLRVETHGFEQQPLSPATTRTHGEEDK